MAGGVGKVSVLFKASTSAFNRGVKRASKNLDKFKSKVISMKTAMVGFGAALAGGALVSYGKKMANEIDQTAKFADSIGIASDKLQEFQFVASLAGAEVEVTNRAFMRMVKTVGEAKQGIGQGKRALDQLGLSADDLARMSPDKQFLKISDAMVQLRTETERVAAASQIFGLRSGTQMVKLLGLGSEEIRKQTAEFKALNLSIRRIEAAAVERMNDSLATTGEIIKTVSQIAITRLAPVVSRINEEFAKMAKRGNFGERVRSAMDSIAIGIAKVIDQIRNLWNETKKFFLDAKVWFAKLKIGALHLAHTLGKFLTKHGILNIKDSAFSAISDEIVKATVNMGFLERKTKLLKMSLDFLFDPDKYESMVRSQIKIFDKQKNALSKQSGSLADDIVGRLNDKFRGGFRGLGEGLAKAFKMAEGPLKMMEKEMQRVKDRIKEIKENSKTDLEIYREKINEIATLYKTGSINAKEFFSERDRIRKDMFGEISTSQDSVRSFREVDLSNIDPAAISRQKKEESHEKKQEELMAKALKIESEQLNLLSGIKDEIGNNQVVVQP